MSGTPKMPNIPLLTVREFNEWWLKLPMFYRTDRVGRLRKPHVRVPVGREAWPDYSTGKEQI